MKWDIAVQAFWLCIVAILWGGTNPLLKKGGQGIESVKKDNVVLQLLAQLYFLICNWRYLLPFLLNQSGSVVYYLTLASADLSLAVPLTNSLTFIFTGISGKIFGEKFGNFETYTGIGLVMVGVTMCVISKM